MYHHVPVTYKTLLTLKKIKKKKKKTYKTYHASKQIARLVFSTKQTHLASLLANTQ